MPIAPDEHVAIRIMWASGRPLEWRYPTSLNRAWWPLEREGWNLERNLSCNIKWELRYADRTE